MRNPFFLQDQAGGTESMGWLDAWEPATSVYAVAATTAADVAAAVDFAREHHMRLAVKGTGHDYLGRSSAPDSLLVWTHAMRAVKIDDAFVPTGCTVAPVPAVSVEAGTRWIEAYQAVMVEHHRYVQGGGCTSVGAAGGFLQGGGFGSWSRKYGIAAASLLEAEVVTADGKTRVVNACQDADLFWALRGGGGGTFGVVTRATLMTHPLPTTFGFVFGKLHAKTPAAFAELLGRFVPFAGETLSTEAWGEQVEVKEDDTLDVHMAFQGMSADDARRAWEPLRAWAAQRPDAFDVHLDAIAVPPEIMWDRRALERRPGIIQVDGRPGAPASFFWWTGDGDQVATYWDSYQSQWLPRSKMQGDAAPALAHALFEASRHWSVGLHFNKGQAGASPEALARDRLTSMNPAVMDAAALVIIGAAGPGFPGVAGHEPDREASHRRRDASRAAMQFLLDATPGAGSYVNETDYFEPDWQSAFWGSNYPRLLAIKRRVDPTGLFTCHHCVGSEDLVER